MSIDKPIKMEAFGYTNEIMGRVTGPDMGRVRFRATGDEMECAAWKVIAYGNFTWLVILERPYPELIEGNDRTTQVDMELAGTRYNDIKVDFSTDGHMLISYYQYPYEG